MTSAEVVNAYYDALEKRCNDWRDFVTDDVKFEGPIQKASGKKEFVALNEQFLQCLRETRVVKRFAEGDNVCSICESVITTPAGKPITVSYAEWARVTKNRISEFRIFYDPRDFARAFGM